MLLLVRNWCKLWNRIEGPKGFDVDAILPFRERLIICYYHEGKKGIGEAYVDEGVWYWWTPADIKVKVQDDYHLVLWTLFPWDVNYENKIGIC